MSDLRNRIQTAAAACAVLGRSRKIAAFEDCARKHPRDCDVVCRRLEAGAAWCMIAQICPQEVEDLECCAGGASSAQMSAGRVPKKCLGKLDQLDACIERHQLSAEPG